MTIQNGRPPSNSSQLDRRRFLAGAGVLAAGAAMTPLLSAHPAFAMTERLFGTGTLSVLSDGNLVLPIDFIAPDAPVAERSALLTQAGLDTARAEPPLNLTLYRDGDRTVLFDVGSGPGFMPSAGALPYALDAMNVDPSEVTHIVFTHAHPDHLWGLLDDFDDFVFPQARYFMSAAEYEFWSRSAVVNEVPEEQQGMAAGAQRRLEALGDAIELFQPGQEVLPGILSHDTSGHTPGHCSFEIANGNDRVMVIGDALNHPVFAFQRPNWRIGADLDSDKGIATRLRFLDMLATDATPLIGYHLPYPGYGVAERDGEAYRFTALG